MGAMAVSWQKTGTTDHQANNAVVFSFVSAWKAVEQTVELPTLFDATTFVAVMTIPYCLKTYLFHYCFTVFVFISRWESFATWCYWLATFSGGLVMFIILNPIWHEQYIIIFYNDLLGLWCLHVYVNPIKSPLRRIALIEIMECWGSKHSKRCWYLLCGPVVHSNVKNACQVIL